MTTETGEITIKDVSHVMQLLVSNLYGHDPHLTVRELVQNAHDALVDLDGRVADNEKQIAIRLKAMNVQPFLEIHDNGAGLSGKELRDNFGKIGDSDKLRRAIDNPNLIGRFGIGFLSAFIVADHVEVLTRKHPAMLEPGEENTHWLWKTENQRTWELKKLTHDAAMIWTGSPGLSHGTRIRLYFRKHYEGANSERINDLRTVDGLESIIRSNCYLLPYPIRVSFGDEGGRVANLVRPPWDGDDLSEEAFKALFGKNEPFFTHRFSQASEDGRYRASGVLFFRDELNRSPSVQLYVKRMLVSPEDRRLIPPYGVFASGIVDCPHLEVDLSRRQVAPFDPAYKWLRSTMLEEFEKAFLSMAKRRMEDFTRVWPSIDNTMIVSLVDAFRNDGDEALQRAARGFLLRAGVKLPFYMVDLISGSQGRPIWQTIEEYAEKRRRELTPEQSKNYSANVEDPVDPRGRIRVRFTKSQQPVEKDLLIERYKELFDVGRSEKAHELVFSVLQALAEDLLQVALVEVQASRFAGVDAQEAKAWATVREVLQLQLVFSGRSHEVMIETFNPTATPILITDTRVDNEQVKVLREHLSSLGGQAGVGEQLLGFLRQLEEKGGSLLIHVNASNDLMCRLRDGLSSSVTEIRVAANKGLALIAWRAVIDYFGWTSTRDMIARDRENAHEVIRDVIRCSSELDQVRALVDTCERKCQDLEGKLAASAGPVEGRKTQAMCGFVDFVNSTGPLMMNANTAPETRWKVFKLLTDELQLQIQQFGGETIAFTGDGVLFIIEKGTDPGVDVGVKLRNLTGAVEAAATKDGDLRRFFQDMQVKPPELRVGMSYGQVYRGQVGPTVNLIGVPVVEAARIAANELIDSVPRRVLVSLHAYNEGCNWLWDATRFEAAGSIEGKGLNGSLNVFRFRDSHH